MHWIVQTVSLSWRCDGQEDAVRLWVSHECSSANRSHTVEKMSIIKGERILREIHMPPPRRHSSRPRPPSLWNADRRKRMGKARIPRSVLSGMAYIALLICSIFPRCPYVSLKHSSHSGYVRSPGCQPFISQFQITGIISLMQGTAAQALLLGKFNHRFN